MNNLTDAISSIVTIGGTKLSARKPDKAHPLGFGRVEYLTALIVAGLVLYAGITSAVESVKKIINPATPGLQRGVAPHYRGRDRGENLPRALR